ncbi:MAG: tetratricopeptide repeat protein [Rubellimicrobium sp.]|nr:tetratricopeptide repeat protein [Rubellimicrobium sp.]
MAAALPTALPALRAEAVRRHQAGEGEAALAAYAAYLSRAPGDGGMWTNYGVLLRTRGQHDLAVAAQERALALMPEAASVLNNLANVLGDIGALDRALDLRRRVLAQTPDDSAQKAMLGKALRTSGRLDEAIEVLTAALATHPQEAELEVQLAMALLAARRHAEGFRHFDARWRTGELTPRSIARPKWQGEQLDGKTILVMPEQGFGDAIAFARFLPVLRRYNPARVFLHCERPLERLFARVEGADRVGRDLPLDEVDLWTNMMDLPVPHFEATEAIPAPTRLTIPEDSRQRAFALTAPFADRFKVGVVWSGSVTYRGNAFRSFPHRAFHTLLDLPDLQMFSLYKGPELAAFTADGSAALIPDFGSSDRDFADCAALMEEMDLIITSDTVTAHLAGSLGRPVWTLLHWDAFWLWTPKGDTTPWYPSMRLIRQPGPRDWDGVFAEVRASLIAALGDRP